MCMCSIWFVVLVRFLISVCATAAAAAVVWFFHSTVLSLSWNFHKMVPRANFVYFLVYWIFYTLRVCGYERPTSKCQVLFLELRQFMLLLVEGNGQYSYYQCILLRPQWSMHVASQKFENETQSSICATNLVQSLTSAANVLEKFKFASVKNCFCTLHKLTFILLRLNAISLFSPLIFRCIFHTYSSSIMLDGSLMCCGTWG